MDALEEMRALLKANGCTVRTGGAREQWTYPHSRRAIVIIDAEKCTLRLCAERIGDYADDVPISLRYAIEHAPNCGGGCRPWGGKKCTGGWRFSMDGCEYVKCRYNAFIFSMVKDELSDVRNMLRMELHARRQL